ncbi:MAG: cupin domain-containing protein [Firmicutes bacterium]|nr:cupin domain-containing protein [Candidatus Fermentithermobacillaceae bacterium]
MQIIKINELPVTRSPRGPKIRNVFSSEKTTITNVLLDPGGILPMHTTPVDTIFYVREGSGYVLIGDERERVVAGDMVISPKNVPHGLEAGEEGFSVLVFKLG